MAKYQTGLIVGRFQPFHKGHLFMLKESLKLADMLIIALGSSNVFNESNPLSFEKREQMIQTVLRNEGLEARVSKIVPSPDVESDAEWLTTLERNAGPFDVAISNNDWTIDVMKKGGHAVEQIPFLERDLYQATFVRELFKAGKKWDDRVPAYLASFIGESL